MLQDFQDMRNTSRRTLTVHSYLFQRTFLFMLLSSGLVTLCYTLSDLRCQRGWSQFGSRCFKIFTTPATWKDAEQNCVNVGGHLASVHSKEEYAFIQALVLNTTKANLQTWLGANDVVQNFVWVWTDGSAFDYYIWSGGQPDDYMHIECCLEMNYPVFWNDRDCMTLNPSACAKAAIPAKIISVVQLKIVSEEDVLESDIERLMQKVKLMLIDSGMPTDTTLRLKNLYKRLI